MTHDDDLRALAATLFAPDDEPDEPDNVTEPRHHQVIQREGSNPDPGPISDDARNKDYVRRLFDDDYDLTHPPLPEEEPR